MHQLIHGEDYKQIKAAMDLELTRRGKTPLADAYVTDPVRGIKVIKETAEKTFKNVYNGQTIGLQPPTPVTVPTINFTIGRIVWTSDFLQAIDYIQKLALQNIRV
jgi:hypothetical protein